MHTWLFLCISLAWLFPLKLGYYPERACPWLTGLGAYKAKRCSWGEAQLLPPLLPSDIWLGSDWPSPTAPWTRGTQACGLEPVLCVIYFAPVPPRCLHRSAFCGGCDSLIKGQVHIFRVHQGLHWLLWINSSTFLFQLQKFCRRRDTFIEFHFAC